MLCDKIIVINPLMALFVQRLSPTAKLTIATTVVPGDVAVLEICRTVTVLNL